VRRVPRFARGDVVIVDDHAGFRTLPARSQAEGFDVVGGAADGPSALALTRRLAPALVLLDVALPDMDGFAVCEALLEDGHGPRTVEANVRQIRKLGLLQSPGDHRRVLAVLAYLRAGAPAGGWPCAGPSAVKPNDDTGAPRCSRTAA
jgi:CheY-like chemotaxis protein